MALLKFDFCCFGKKSFKINFFPNFDTEWEISEICCEKDYYIEIGNQNEEFVA
jgi:hypothetical protein